MLQPWHGLEVLEVAQEHPDTTVTISRGLQLVWTALESLKLQALVQPLVTLSKAQLGLELAEELRCKGGTFLPPSPLQLG